MKKNAKIREAKGITGIDIAISILIVSIFAGVISAMFYNIYIANESIKRSAVADQIVQNVFEAMSTDKYANIGNDYLTKNPTVTGGFAGYTTNLQVEKYVDTPEGTGKNDIIKKVTLTVSYKIGGKTENKEVKTLIVDNEV